MKLRHILLLSLLLRVGLPLTLAQSDTVAVSDTVVFSTDDIRFIREVPLTRDLSHLRVSDPRVSRSEFSRHFLELVLPFGHNYAERALVRGAGVHYAYLPKRWGLYGEASYCRFYLSDDYFRPSGQASAGLVMRPMLKPTPIDWQLYAGAAAGGLGFGYEVGSRIACGPASSPGRFSWLSCSLGVSHTTQGFYLTIGLSLSASLCALLFFAN